MNVFFFFYPEVLKIRMVEPLFLVYFINDNMIFKKLSTITKPKSAIYICFRNVYAMI